MGASTAFVPQKFLRPYDPEVVQDALGSQLDPELLTLQGRCVEDRPEELLGDDNFAEVDAMLDEVLVDSTVDLAQIRRLKAAGLQVPDIYDHDSPLGMLVNAQLNGSSQPGGLWTPIIGQAVGMEMTRQGSFIDLDMSLNVLGGVIHGIAPKLGRFHEACLARDAVRNLLEFAATPEGLTTARNNAVKAMPWVKELLDDTLLTNFGDTAERLLKSEHAIPEDNVLVPVNRLRRREDKPDTLPPHAGKHIVAINNVSGPNVIWDTLAAWKAGQPAYAFNAGHVPSVAERLSRSLNNYLGRVATDKFVAAVALYTGATIYHLPGKPKIVTIGNFSQ